jgi:hypothetical protein
MAALEALWMEEAVAFPQSDIPITWEIWLRRHRGLDHLARLRDYAEHFNLTVGDQAITFVDRTVVLVTGTADDLSRSVEILGMIAEVRMPKTTAAFFTEMAGVEQQELVDDLVSRIVAPGAGTPFVCLLDTGLNQAHPLLSQIANPADLHTYRLAWASMTVTVTEHRWPGWLRSVIWSMWFRWLGRYRALTGSSP